MVKSTPRRVLSLLLSRMVRFASASRVASGLIMRSGKGIRGFEGAAGPTRTVPKHTEPSLPGHPAPRSYASDSMPTVSPSANGPTARSARSPGVSSSSVAPIPAGRRPPPGPRRCGQQTAVGTQDLKHRAADRQAHVARAGRVDEAPPLDLAGRHLELGTG